jgi:hypothetical protein
MDDTDFEIISIDQTGIASIETVRNIEESLGKYYQVNGSKCLDAYLKFFAMNGASEKLDDHLGISIKHGDIEKKFTVREFKKVAAIHGQTIRSVCRSCSGRTQNLLQVKRITTKLSIEMNMQDDERKYWCFDFADRDSKCPIKEELLMKLKEINKRKQFVRE